MLLSAVSVGPAGSASELAWPVDWSSLTELLGSASAIQQFNEIIKGLAVYIVSVTAFSHMHCRFVQLTEVHWRT